MQARYLMYCCEGDGRAFSSFNERLDFYRTSPTAGCFYISQFVFCLPNGLARQSASFFAPGDTVYSDTSNPTTIVCFGSIALASVLVHDDVCVDAVSFLAIFLMIVKASHRP